MRPDETFSILRPNFFSEAIRDNALFLELMFWIVVVVLALILLKTRPAFLRTIELYGKRLARQQTLAILVVIFSSLAVRAVLLVTFPIPEPEVHDEYSHLLQAETFASGRMTNPTPAGWEHFETFHVNMRPTYQSMYPPGQALFLAIPRVLGLPAWWGVWLSVGLMCGAVCWMLQGWMPPQWAFLGGLFCVVRFSTFSYWMQSYFGGAVAAIGGALVFGALIRLKKNWSPRYGVVLALGLGLMANTRAYEGFVFAIPPTVLLAWWLFSAWRKGSARFRRLVPGVAVMLIIGGLMGYYNWRNTGSPLKVPYMVNQDAYHITKPFIWQTAYKVPNYRHQVMRTFFAFHELPDYFNRRNPGWGWKMARERFEVYYDFFVWPMMIPALLATWIGMKRTKRRIFPITILVVMGSLLVEQWPPQGHYAAPILCVVLATVLYGFRLLWTWRPKGQPVGAMMVRSAIIVLFLWLLVPLQEKVSDPYDLAKQTKFGHTIWMPSQIERARIMSQLQQIPGRHIVFVHFHRTDIGGIFWIYNEPDVANSKIIWAHDMGSDANQEFMRLYGNRKSWIVDKDDILMQLLPYSPAPAPSDSVLATYKFHKTNAQ